MTIPTVGVFIPTFANFHTEEIPALLRYWAAHYRINLVLIRTNGHNIYNVETALHHCDAFICIHDAVDEQLIKSISVNKPVIAVCTGRYSHLPNVELVCSDQYSGMIQLVEHLKSLGHTRIGLICERKLEVMREREQAFYKAMDDSGLEYSTDDIYVVDDLNMEQGRRASVSYINSRPEFTALIAANDILALGFQQGLYQHGLKCPDDLAIAGIDATNIAHNFTPKLTSVDQNLSEVIEQALHQINTRLNTPSASANDTVHIPQTLYIGESTSSDDFENSSEAQFCLRKSVLVDDHNTNLFSIQNRDALFTFAKSGFDSLLGISYLFGPFMQSGYRARWQGEDIQTFLNIYSCFTESGYKPISGKIRYPAQEFPPLEDLTNSTTPFVVTILPINAAQTNWEVIAIFDQSENVESYSNLTLFYNYLDLISESLERDAYALISRRKEEEALLLSNHIMELNATLEKRVEQRTDELEKLNQTLETKNEDLKKVSQYKTDFISNMSHELRTPLNSITGFSKILLRSCDKGDKRTTESLSAIERNCIKLKELINDVLDVSKMEAGFISLNVTKADLIPLVTGVAKDMQHQAEEKNLILDVTHHNATEKIESQVDPLRINQIVTNLISNAIKYTDTGRIDVEIGMTHYKQLGLCNFISVTDTGMGIPEESIKQLFSKFGRLTKHERSNIEGTGLGLAIVKELVQLHHGHIEVESFVGQGSCFRIYLPG